MKKTTIKILALAMTLAMLLCACSNKESVQDLVQGNDSDTQR